MPIPVLERLKRTPGPSLMLRRKRMLMAVPLALAQFGLGRVSDSVKLS